MANTTNPGSIKHLLEGARLEAQGGRATLIPLDQLKDSPFQNRLCIDEEKLQELAGSIQAHGLLQPILVRPNQSGWEIVFGHRRTAAYKSLLSQATTDADRAKWASIPAIERSISDEEMYLDLLSENLQRDDPSAVEAASGLADLQQRYSLTRAQVAEKLNLSEDRVDRLLRLHAAPAMIKAGITTGVMVPVLDDNGQPVLGSSGRPRHEHRRLDMMAALEIVRLWEHLSRDNPKKASPRIEALIKRALTDNMSFRRIKSVCAEMRSGKAEKPATADKAQAPLYTDKNGTLTVFENRLSKGSLAELDELLLRLESAVIKAKDASATLRKTAMETN